MHDPSTAPRGVHPVPPFLWFFHWQFKPLTSPKTFDTFIIYLPACVPQQCSNPTIAISTVLARQLDHISDQAFFVSTPLWQSTLRGSVLAQNATNPSLRNLKLRTQNQCRHGGAKGSEVSRCGFLQDQLVQCQVRNRTPQTLVLLL